MQENFLPSAAVLKRRCAEEDEADIEAAPSYEETSPPAYRSGTRRQLYSVSPSSESLLLRQVGPPSQPRTQPDHPRAGLSICGGDCRKSERRGSPLCAFAWALSPGGAGRGVSGLACLPARSAPLASLRSDRALPRSPGAAAGRPRPPHLGSPAHPPERRCLWAANGLAKGREGAALRTRRLQLARAGSSWWKAEGGRRLGRAHSPGRFPGLGAGRQERRRRQVAAAAQVASVPHARQCGALLPPTAALRLSHPPALLPQANFDGEFHTALEKCL